MEPQYINVIIITVMNKQMLAILKVLNQHPEAIVGSRELSRQLTLLGVELTERTVRYHMKMLDERGFTRVFGKEGRQITEKGREELRNAVVSDRVGFIISKIENLAFQTTFDLDRREGKVILNVTLFPARDVKAAIKVMGRVFGSPYIMSDKLILVREGDQIGDTVVPEGMVAIGTVCSVTINGVFLKNGIPVVSRFGGVIEVDEGRPSRFTAILSYDGSSIDPLVLFIRGRMTSVGSAVTEGRGKILGSFREIPVMSLAAAQDVQRRLAEIGIGGILTMGNPNQPLLEMPVGMDRAGMVIVGGLNPVAALEESGIHTESTAMAVLYDYERLTPFSELGARESSRRVRA